MRKGILILTGMSILLGMLLFAGCEGDKGLPGDVGKDGDRGVGGIDPDKNIPADRYFGVGVLNATETAVTGDMRVFVTFDTTQRASRDTVVAARVSRPPLIDGVDGEEPEWGEQKSRIRSIFLNTTGTLSDPGITEIVCRIAYDENYIYGYFNWKERPKSVRVADHDSTIYAVTSSEAPKEIVLDASKLIVTDIDSSRTPPETTFFDAVRVPILDADTTYCEVDFFDPSDTLWCDVTYVLGDTTLVWFHQQTFDDKLVLFWGDTDVPNWSEYAFREFFGTPGLTGALPAGLRVDAWVWGSATSNPVLAADDWYLNSNGKSPDFGAPPYMDNFVFPDSVPRYMNFRDPNVKTASNLLTKIYPLWYFDVVGYSTFGWALNRPAYVPGIITTIPSDSRADIYARALFDDSGGNWTLEIRRARKTHYGDDVDF